MKIPILMYHEIIDENPSEVLLEKVQRSYLVNRENFSEQMAYLSESGYTSISLSEAMDALKGKGKTAEKPVVITFDDGFLNNYNYALPILRKYGLTATFFISTGLVGKPWMLNWDQIREMNRAGMSIESHTVTHSLLSTRALKELEFEFTVSRKIIEKEVGSPVNFLTYPHGDYNARVMGYLKKTGYLGACSSRFGINNPGTKEFAMKRIKIANSYGIEDFRGVLGRNKKMYFFLKTKDLLLYSLRGMLGTVRYETMYTRFFSLKSDNKKCVL